MSEYLLGVIGTVLLCSLLTAVAPEGKTSAVIKGMARLGCVLAIIAPVLQFFKTGEVGKFTDDFFMQSGIETDKEFIQYYSELRIRETESALERELSEKYSLETEVTLVWTMEAEEFDEIYIAEHIKIEKICVEVPRETTEEVKERVSAYLTKNYCSEVLIE